jgi:pimeloyl-ACP methyl ester carboxylesterase
MDSRHFECWNVQAEGDVVLLVHSKKTNRMIWQKNVPFLVQRGYYVVLVDLPGFGQHKVEVDSATLAHPKLYGAFLDKVLSHLKIEPHRCHVVGLALGGFGALQLATMRPLVKSLTLVCSPGGIMTEAIAKCKAESDQHDRSFSGTWDALRHQGAESDLMGFLADSEHCLKDINDAFLYRLIARQNDRWIAEKNFKEWMQEARISPGGLAMPCLVMAGECDSSWSVAALQEVARELQSKEEVVVFLGVGHTPPFEVPEAFNAALVKFWASV